MQEENKKPLSLVAQMKQNAIHQKREPVIEKAAGMDTVACPNCGAGRAKSDGLTKCGYCGFSFLTHQLNDGIHIKKTDNSK
ncbi:hypothetical protein [Niabella beijingensis]|uniref:hypothetical protein n=1 Tax=Niabella beijingensis TaxID=2872700 RepID=UPI001CBFED09|nr:hypothetical protein [Niabella beijingensis]MBZ4192675.1 hypothetical protein [Niabella beijingensis]